MSKSDSIDNYPYIVFTENDNIVYSSDETHYEPVSGTIEITENGTGIDVASYAYADVSVSGGSSTGKVYFLNPVESPSYPVVEVDGVETELVDDVLVMGGEQMPCKSVTAVIGAIIDFDLVDMEIMACSTVTSDISFDVPYTFSSGNGTVILPHESAFIAFTVN